MKDFSRIIIWSTLGISFLILGILGMARFISKTTISKEDKDNLKLISKFYNDSSYINELKENNTLSSSKIKRNEFIISYSDEVVETEYVYTYKNNNLYIELDNNDENGWLVTKYLVDAISISKGKEEKETFKSFNNIKVNRVSNDDALSIAYGESKTEVNIRTDISLKKYISSELINYNLLESNYDKIVAFEYSYSEDNILLNLTKSDVSKMIKLSQMDSFDERSYSLVVKLMSYVLDSKKFNDFIQKYPTILEDEETVIDDIKIKNVIDKGSHVLTIEIMNDESNQE